MSATPSTATTAGDRLRNRIYGTVGGLLVVGALFLLVAGLGPSVDLETLDAPTITLEGPEDGATIQGPLRIEFDPGTHIRPGPRGWGVQPLHLHLAMNRREFMPTRHDIVPLEGRRYRWELPPFTPGEYTIRLLWATEDHGSIPHGASEEVTIRIEEPGRSRAEPHPSPSPHH